MSGHSESDGSGDSGVMQATGPSRDAVKKLDQIIQVCSQKCWKIILHADVFFAELPYESCDPYITITNVVASDNIEGRN